MTSGLVVPQRVMVWRRQDGSISISVPVPGKEAKHCAELHKLGYERLPDCEVAALPDRAKRHAWRAHADGTLFVDPTVLEPPASRDLRIEALEARLAKLEGKDANLRP